jgi:glucose-1-phosphate cytidylyltransferase
MKVVILAGGLGTRLAEETEVRPKPMVEIGNWPILWHIMKLFACYSHREFFVALGYRGDFIKRYFVDYYSLNGTMTIDLPAGELRRQATDTENWILHLVDTGAETNTGGRVKRLESSLRAEPFLLTYGDGVSNIDLNALVQFHKEQGRIGTVTAVHPPARFGDVVFDGDLVAKFTEKNQAREGWINGGFMVFEPQVFDYLRDDHTSLESDVLEQLAADRQLAAYRHPGFWQCMDTLRDKRLLEKMWADGSAPWRVWQ